MKTGTVIAICLAPFACFAAMRLTNTFNWYTTQTRSCEPTYHIGDRFAISRFKQPANGNFICYRAPDSEIYIKRCMGMENDVIEIKNGDVYRNGKKLEENYTATDYVVTKAQADKFYSYFESHNKELTPVSGTDFYVSLSQAELEELKLQNLPKVVFPKGDSSMPLYAPFAKAGYTIDNFGPVKVPANSYFVMGDNRHNSLDSRFSGFVNKDRFVGSVVF